jgi:hypothetical protein
MLPGFERETIELAADERLLLQGFINALKKYVGPENTVTSIQIMDRYKDRGIKISGARVRKIISYIRDEALIPGLVASSKGYYISKDPADIYRWIQSLEGRETKIRMIRKRAEEYLHALQNKGQTRIDL